MNIKDLNLEDLVLYVDKEEGIETPCKINSLNSNGEWAAQILNSEFIFQGDNNECSVEKCLLPIPLTVEILEENGFVHERGYSSDIYCLNEYFLVRYEHKKYYAVWLSEDVNEDLDKVITYVHELQHALRLCGIDKEIVL